MTESKVPDTKTQEGLPPYSDFKDSQGHVWRLQLTVGLIEDVQTESGLDLDQLLKDPRSFATLLVEQPKQLVMGLWVMCKDQAERDGIDPKAFGKRFDRETLDAAADALCDAVLAFYPRGSAGRVLRGKLPAILRSMDKEIGEKVGQRLDQSYDTATS